MRYHAFISYSHAADARLAPALESGLKSFASRWLWVRALDVFRDKTSLALTPALWPAIERALSETDFFILLASPDAAASPWVRREVDWWLQNRSTDKLLIVLTDGELCWDAAAARFDEGQSSALPPALCTAFPNEPLWLDLRWARSAHDLKGPRFQEAIAEIASPIHGKPKDQLFGEDVRQHKRRMRLARGAIAGLAVLALTAIGFAVMSEINRREATRQRAEAERQAAVARRQADIALARQLVAQSDFVRTPRAADLQLSTLLGVEALRRFRGLGMRAFEAEVAVRRSSALMPQPVTTWDAGAPVDSLRFSRDGQRLTTASRHLATTTWDVQRAARIASSPARSKQAQTVALSSEGTLLAVGTEEGDAYLVGSGAVRSRFNIGEGQHVRAVAVSRDGDFIAVAGRDSLDAVVMVRRVDTGEEVGTVPWSYAVEFSPDGKFLAAGRGLWEIVDARGKHALEAIELPVPELAGVQAVTFSGDSRYFARAISQVTDRSVEIWSLAPVAKRGDVRFDVPANALALSNGGRYVAVATAAESSLGFVVQLLEAGAAHAATLSLSTAATAVAFRPGTSELATGEISGRVTMWKVATLADIERIRPAGRLESAIFDEDAAMLITASWAHPDEQGASVVVESWPLGSRGASATRTFRITAFAFSANGRFMAGEHAGAASVWEVASGQLRRRVPFSGLVSRAMAVSDDGRFLAVMTDKDLSVWDLTTTQQAGTMSSASRQPEFNFEGTTPEIVLGPDGWYAAAVFRRPSRRTDRTEAFETFVRVWDIRASKELFTEPLGDPHPGERGLSFSADGRRLAIASGEHRLKVIELERGPKGAFDLESALVRFSPDGNYLLTSGVDPLAAPFRAAFTVEGMRGFAATPSGSVAQVWDVATQAEWGRIEHEPGSEPIAISSKGRYIASRGPDGAIRVSTVASDALLSDACSRLSRNLTPAEWKRFLGDAPYEKTCANLP